MTKLSLLVTLGNYISLTKYHFTYDLLKMTCYGFLILISIFFFLYFSFILGLLVCMKIIESQSNSLPNPKPKPNPKSKAQDVGQLRADFNQALSDRTDYASGES